MKFLIWNSIHAHFCGAVLLRGMKKGFCCNGDKNYKNKLPNPDFPVEILGEKYIVA